MSNAITCEDCVTDLNQDFLTSRDMNSLLLKLHWIPELKSVRGVVPTCIEAARRAASHLGGLGGVTQVVDGESIACAVAFASKSTSNIEDKILACLRNVYKTGSPRHFIVAFDSDRSFRKDLLASFKADRPDDPIKRELDAARPMIVQSLTDAGIQVEVHDGREADDVIASVATQCQILGEECLIVTEDKDCWQALGPNTTIYSRRGDAFYGTTWLMQEHKISPKQVIDWLCMVGKNGVDGVSGIGKTTASNLLHSYGSYIDAMLTDSVAEKHRLALKEFDYWTARSVHTLDRRLRIGRSKYQTHDADGPA
jgi:5'-3' exonuclease